MPGRHGKQRRLKLIPLHTSVTYQISRIHWISVLFRENLNEQIKTNRNDYFIYALQNYLSTYSLIEFSHHKPVNKFTEFGEFLLDTDGEIATCSWGIMYYP